MDRKLIFLAGLLILVVGAYWGTSLMNKRELAARENSSVLEEAAQIKESKHAQWWLKSGGRVKMEEGAWWTIQGQLSGEDEWRKFYLRRNPMDTDNGYHPQNIFKLFSKGTYQNPVQELQFEILADQMSMSPNRNETSGIFLYSRYANANNYYYAGLQVDGRAVIRKKSNGLFHTAAETEIVSGEYDPQENPNLLPKNTPITIRTELIQNDQGILIKLFINEELMLEELDRGIENGPLIERAGLVGIRSDFMDVKFTGYTIEETLSTN